ncbi:MAG: MBL fold metallo-hydrolase [Methanotrichaceae archaeon]|nr:MBL fold metallo-hydrolase [Methanotrichaceae archaeon]
MPEEISLLVLTHSHLDHIGAAKAIKRESGCTVASHKAERSWIQDVDLQAKDRPVPDFHNLVEGPVEVDRILEDGEMLNLGNDMDIKVIHTSGHSKGSISIWFPREGALFCGDSIPLANDMPIYEDILESVLSIKRLNVLEGIQVLLSSWDKPQWGKNAYLKMDEGLCYLQEIHEAVLRVSKNRTFNDSLELARSVLIELEMPGSIANPLVAKSFQNNLKLMGMEDLNSCQSNLW